MPTNCKACKHPLRLRPTKDENKKYLMICKDCGEPYGTISEQTYRMMKVSG